MNLEQDIARWDGKSSQDIAEIFSCYAEGETFLGELLALHKNVPSQKGASWLLKRYLERDGKIGRGETSKIVKTLSSLRHWESRLHVLQCLPFMSIAVADKESVERFLRICLTDSNKMVRAWSYNGFYELSMQYPEYVSETKQFFDMAMKDEAPSVKARIRNILKAGF